MSLSRTQCNALLIKPSFGAVFYYSFSFLCVYITRFISTFWLPCQVDWRHWIDHNCVSPPVLWCWQADCAIRHVQLPRLSAGASFSPDPWADPHQLTTLCVCTAAGLQVLDLLQGEVSVCVGVCVCMCVT